MAHDPLPSAGLAALILPRQSTAEVRAVLTACMLASRPPTVIRADAAELGAHAHALRTGSCMPVGSVEYVRAALAIAEIPEPQCDPYPPSLLPWMGRSLVEATAAAALAADHPLFVKPAGQLKAFDGFVLRPGQELDEHGREQLAALRTLPGNSPVWTSDPVEFLSEWRFYVQDGQILGSGRYDPDGLDSAPAPDVAAVQEAIAAYGRSGSYALDMGVLANGRTAIVEVNDAWATGLYAGALTHRAYLDWLASRWLAMAARRATESQGVVLTSPRP